MKPTALAVFVVLSAALYGAQGTFGEEMNPKRSLTLELRTGTSRVHPSDTLALTLIFRSRTAMVTLWNAFGFNVQSGLSLLVMDASGRRVAEYYDMGEYAPPDKTGRGAVITIGYDTFAGIDRRIPATELFPGPGTYTLRCIYRPKLPRDYFTGMTIWGAEEGAVESAPLRVSVSK